MILKRLKNSDFILIIFFLIFAILFFIPSYLSQESHSAISNKAFNPIILLIISCLITYLHSIGLNNLIYEKDIIKRPNLIVPFVFLLLTTPFNIDINMIIYSFGCLFFLNYILKIYKNIRPDSVYFNSSVILSCISIVFPYIFYLAPLIYFSGIIFRNINWKHLIISVIGGLVPYIFLYAYQLYFNKQLDFIIELNKSSNFLNLNTLNPHEKLWYLCVMIIILFSFIELFKWIYKKSIRSRESFMIIILYVVLTTIVFFVSNSSTTIYLSLSPLSIIIANFFIYHKRIIISESLFIIFVFSSIYYRISMIYL